MHRISPFLIRHLMALILFGMPVAAHAEMLGFGDCYARWQNGRLTVGNAHFERAWVAGNVGLLPVSFRLKNPDTEWLADSARKAKVSGTLEVVATQGRRSVVGSEGI